MLKLNALKAKPADQHSEDELVNSYDEYVSDDSSEEEIDEEDAEEKKRKKQLASLKMARKI